jgi:hypothetical protein
MAPEIVCGQWRFSEKEPQLALHTDLLPELESWLRDPEIRIVGHHVAYDVAVTCAEWPSLLPLWFEAYDADRVTDTMWREILIDTACGRYRFRTAPDGKVTKVNYGLADLAHRHLGRVLWGKKGGPRTTYGPLRGVPISQWSEDHVRYAKDDAVHTLDVYEAQEELNRLAIAEHGVDLLSSQFRETRAYLALHLASVWGLRTDAAKVSALETQTVRAVDVLEARLKEAGFVRPAGTRDMKRVAAYMAEVCAQKGLLVLRTPAGGISLDSEACDRVDDDLLNDYAEYVTLKALLNKDVKLLREGTVAPIHTRFGFAESDRVTSSSPNVQNFSRSA